MEEEISWIVHIPNRQLYRLKIMFNNEIVLVEIDNSITLNNTNISCSPIEKNCTVEWTIRIGDVNKFNYVSIDIILRKLENSSDSSDGINSYLEISYIQQSCQSLSIVRLIDTFDHLYGNVKIPKIPLIQNGDELMIIFVRGIFTDFRIVIEPDKKEIDMKEMLRIELTKVKQFQISEVVEEDEKCEFVRIYEIYKNLLVETIPKVGNPVEIECELLAKINSDNLYVTRTYLNDFESYEKEFLEKNLNFNQSTFPLNEPNSKDTDNLSYVIVVDGSKKESNEILVTNHYTYVYDTSITSIYKISDWKGNLSNIQLNCSLVQFELDETDMIKRNENKIKWKLNEFYDDYSSIITFNSTLIDINTRKMKELKYESIDLVCVSFWYDLPTKQKFHFISVNFLFNI
ncbi:hypothetical protein SNEBB_010546 [Seison nebaliae]|nr:hypothetical protein SNEBB_010546 [Seison nebaliae]